MYKEKDSFLCMLLLFILLPYLLTVLILGRKACPLSRDTSLEDYVPAVTASQISWDYSKEAIKVQTLAARSTLYSRRGKEEEKEIIEEAVEFIRKQKVNSTMLEKYQVFWEAAMETEGQVLKKDGEIKEIPYHWVSGGKTRDGKEILGDKYSYIPSVDTAVDIDSSSYVQGCYFSEKELEKKIREKYPGFTFSEEDVIEIKKTDTAGYVVEIAVGNQIFQGEEIKELLNLPSSCFTVQVLEGEIRFLCRGIGHGLGLSQFTVQKMALEGKKYEEILQYFFPELTIDSLN